MSWTNKIFFLLVLGCFPIGIMAQSISVDDSQNATALVQKLTNNASCIIVSGETAKGDPLNLTQNSYGIFTKNSSSFPFSSGIVLSTWSSKNSEGPYTNLGGGTNWNGDSDINSILGINPAIANNATSLEFDFIAQTNYLSFNYIFASNEYIKDNPCKYSDGLALLIKDVTLAGSYSNLAVLPDGTTVSSKNIHPAINYSDTFTNTKCDAKNESYFGQFNSINPGSSAINYAGQTIPLTAKTTLIIGNKYHIKLVITNDIDNGNNSAVFVEAGSFSSKIDLGKDRLITDNSAICTGETFEIKTNMSNTAYTFKWYKDGSASPLTGETNPSLMVTQAGTYKVEVINSGCTFTGEIKIEYTIGMGLKDVQLAKCDDNGLGTAFFDLTSLKTLIANNNPDTTISGFYMDSNLTIEITNPTAFEKTNSGDQIVYAKGINSKFTCSETAQITLKTLASSQNLVGLPNPIIKEFTGGKNSIELITPATNANYEFSIDGINYQSNTLFTSVSKGNYIAYVRNTTTCEFATYPFTILDYPTFFTPNGDGFNDIWKIDGLDLYPQAVISIFDRFGKLLKQMNSNSVGWNGNFNGTQLPADDYWFRLILDDNQIVNGHFSLKR
ncbi:MAG: T9SS type B sorting domain-containing protein [Flavobacterium sp.]|nr:T9SS type B sorting domain-containing protein [Flavobacterium sp.]